jgi:hypothetical protein
MAYRASKIESSEPFYVLPPQPHEICNGTIYLVVNPDDNSRSWTNPAATIDSFISRWPPSHTSVSYCNWIQVQVGGVNDTSAVPRSSEHAPAIDLQARIEAMKGAFLSMIADPPSVSVSALDELAKDYAVLTGKWMVFCDSSNVDERWRSIVQMLVARYSATFVRSTSDRPPSSGIGLGVVKVSPDKGENHHVICFYVKNFTDNNEVKEVRDALREAGIGHRIGFKPDVYTHLGIYKQNTWGIKPNRFWS